MKTKNQLLDCERPSSAFQKYKEKLFLYHSDTPFGLLLKFLSKKSKINDQGAVSNTSNSFCHKKDSKPLPDKNQNGKEI